MAAGSNNQDVEQLQQLRARVLELERLLDRTLGNSPPPEDNEKQLRILDIALSHTPDFTYIFDLQGRFRYMNQALLSLWQRRFSEAVGKNFFELDYPSDLATRLQRQIQQVIDTKTALRDQTPYTGPTGYTAFYEYIFVPVLAEDGSVEAVAGSTREITARMQTETLLRESEQRFHQLANAMPQIVWTATPDGALDYTNEQLTTFSGLPSGAALGSGWLSIVHPDDQEKAVRRWAESLSTGEPYETEFRLRAAHGEWRSHLVRAQATRNEAQQIVRWFGTCTDIQVQKDTARELARSNAELAVFAHVAAHDLQAPLRMVKSYTQLLQRRLQGKLDDDCLTFMRTVVDGADRMEQLIRGLLNYAQVGHGEPERRPVSMEAVAAEALQNLEPLIAVSKAEVSLMQLPTVLGDGVQLLQLLQNLLSNAIKYRRQDESPRVQVSAEQAGTTWVFAVKDNGLGIAGEYHDKVFQPLERLHGPDVSGTGIGLAVCRKIVERHGGRIWVDSEAGKGATFYFTLPLEQRAQVSTSA